MTKELDDHLGDWNANLIRGGVAGQFIKDGNVGSDEQWKNAPQRVLVLTKDCNDVNGQLKFSDFDLRRLLRDSDRYCWNSKRLENNVGRWAYLIHCAANGSFPDFEEVGETRFRNALLQSAVVNLKKTAGGASAKFPEIRAAATRDRDRILKQISILEPTFVVFGRDKDSTPLVERIIGNLTSCGDLCYWRGPQIWIRHWHPCHRFKNDKTLYDELSQTIRGFSGH